MNKSRGFTLIEVMVALTLLSMMMVAIIAAMRTFGNTKATIGTVTDRVDEVRVVSEFLRKTIGNAMPVVGAGDSEASVETFDDSIAYFKGDDAHLTWVSSLLAGADLGGSYVLSLQRQEEKLVLTWQLYQRENYGAGNDGLDSRDAQDDGSEEQTSRVLLETVEEFEVGYLARYGEEWLEQWGGQANTPVAVRLNIKSSGTYWPELVIRLNGATVNQQ